MIKRFLSVYLNLLLNKLEIHELLFNMFLIFFNYFLLFISFMNFKKFTNYQFKLYLNSVKSNNRIISLDLGSNNVGIAISDYQLK